MDSVSVMIFLIAQWHWACLSWTGSVHSRSGQRTQKPRLFLNRKMPVVSYATGRKKHIAEPHFLQNYAVVERMSATGATTPLQGRPDPEYFPQH